MRGEAPTREWEVVTADEQRRLDAQAAEVGASQDALVESAGRSAAEWILAHAPTRRAVVLAGPGGNGADALVVARCLRKAGADVETFLWAPGGAPSPAAARALARLRDEGGTAARIGDDQGLGGIDVVERALESADLAVDGLYGSGLARPLAGSAAVLVDAVRRAAKRVVSLDLPSGVAADGSLLAGPAVRADVTLAMEFLKPAHLLFPAAELAGRVAVVRVAYPNAVRESTRPWARVLAPEGAAHRLPRRPSAGHKGTFGHVVLVAGSAGMVGAAILSGRAALRAGAGLLTLAIPASQAGAAHAALPEALVVPLSESGAGLNAAAADALAPRLDGAVLAIGPGLSRSEEAGDAVVALLARHRGAAVVDADALYALARRPDALGLLAGRAILTPHPGEFAWFSGTPADRVDRDRVAAAGEFAVRHGVIAVLKGRPTAIGLPDGRVFLNPTGNTGLATGGSGDVLTGVVAGLVASGRREAPGLEDAALVGAYVHGRSAELFSRQGAERSLMPSDVIDLLPRAFLEVERCD